MKVHANTPRYIALIGIVGGLAGCLGGNEKPAADAAPEPDTGVVASECSMAMEMAPTGDMQSFADALPTAAINTWDPMAVPTAGDPAYPGGQYRTLTPDGNGDIHPGCSTEGLAYPAATIQDYPCAAKQYPFPDGVEEDTTRPIVLLIHGNSDSPAGWESFVHPDPKSLDFPADTEARDQLASAIPAAGFLTLAVDLRIDLVDDPASDNPAKNIDHGWAVPIAQAFIKQVIIANPGRRISIVGFSLGGTVVRDSLRRLFVEFQTGAWDVNVFERLQDVVLASGANHGVSTFALSCGSNPTMVGTVTCEMGQRNQFSVTEFHRPLTGPAIDGLPGGEFGGWYETPCADGSYAFGQLDACGGNTVQYTTITMQDLDQGSQQDEFVSEHASRLYPTECASNIITGLNDFDTSGYFFNGLFRNHFGAVRSNAGMGHVMAALTD